MDADLFVGIDLGGTKINTALVDVAGRIVAQDYRATQAAEGPEAVIQRMAAAAREVMAGVEPAQVRAVGVGAPGPIDARTATVEAPPNLPGWSHIPLGQRIADILGLPTFLENDANAAALGEHAFGAGRDTCHMIYVTASTGIGGGLIIGGQLYRGITGGAAEIGHITILPDGPPCTCGQRGCLEALASGTAIAREAGELVAQGGAPGIAALVQGDPARVTARIVAQAADQGDAVAQGILGEAMSYLGLGMANLVDLLNPEMLVIGGGMANMGEMLFGPVRRAVEQYTFPSVASAVRVVPAALGNDAGVVGAAVAAMIAVRGER